MRAMSAGVPAMMVRACSVTWSTGQSHQAARSSSSTSASENRWRIGRAGLPPTIVYGGTSAVTTEPAAMIRAVDIRRRDKRPQKHDALMGG
ncbi:hypothetical protein [Nocardia camponoti]|uniref:hypothetical protein n=1 Tax=Nocardia camponoti TaxID=1616106 RepID=UPI00166B8733|nr:hypothetical protein [Nocardia camponoti]